MSDTLFLVTGEAQAYLLDFYHREAVKKLESYFCCNGLKEKNRLS
jgi:hypothetical protein